MKPLVLRMSAFGPFATEQVVDFRELGARSFFLVHGQTGAGKTSILDGICFALFGQASGRERQGTDLRSDHAEPVRRTEVTFDFELGGETYRVDRIPKQERPKKRGAGTTTQDPDATLWRRTHLEDPSHDGEVLATGWAEVNEATVGLLRFNNEQFRQVVVLPQGDFRRLLVAKVQDREKILETLFGTDHYKRIEQRLKSEAEKVRSEIVDVRQKRSGVLESQGVSSSQDLDVRSEDLRARRTGLMEEVAEKKKRAEQARQTYEAGKEIDKLFQERALAKADYDKVTAEEERIVAKQGELELARKAAPIAGLLEQVRTRRDELEEARRAREQAEHELRDSDEKKLVAGQRHDEEKEREPEREAARREVDRLEGLAEQFRALDALKGAFAARQKEHDERVEALNVAEKTLEEKTLDLETAKDVLEKTRFEAARGTDARTTLLAAKQTVEDHTELRRVRSDLEKARAESREAETKLTEAEAASRARAEDYERVLRAWIDGQAAILARELGEGRPCPVCGSLDHPAPAVATEETPSQAKLDKAKKRMEQGRRERDDVNGSLIDLRNKVRSLDEREGDLARRLGDRADLSAEEIRAVLEAATTAASKAEDAERSLRERETAVKDAAAAVSEARSSRDAAERGARAAASELAGAKAVLDEQARKLPPDLSSTVELVEATEKARSRFVELRAALERAASEAQRASEAAARAAIKVEERRKNVAAAETALAAANENLLGKLREAGFATEELARAAFRTDLEISDLDAEIQDHRARYRSSRDRYERAQASCAGKNRPDIESLAAASDGAEKVLEEINARVAKHDQELAELVKTIKTLATYDEREKSLREEDQVIGRLADTATGKNSLRTSFQRYVLATRLEEVLVSANVRLRQMSQGRFSLQRMLGPEKMSKLGGLDLQVHDTYTGTSRSVATLSGGESFMASLSLALGLADVVQAEHGGVYLDTIFVDEGFGSLDPEALDRAIDTLLTLQEGGRLVGIVSHVPELQSRIDTRLEVTRGDHGSTARFVLG